MRKISSHEDQLLTDYLDGLLDQQKRETLETRLKTDADLHTRFETLREGHELMKATSLQQPSKNFTAMVMRRLNDYPMRSSLSIRNGIFLLAGILVLVSIAVALSAAGAFDREGVLNLNELVVSEKSFRQNLPSIPVDGEWIVNSIIVLNLGIALIVFDRAVLKPFFERRRQIGV